MTYQRVAEKAQPACGYCGRTLGTGFYYICHICGAAYCYAHKPERCAHRKSKVQPVAVSPRNKK